MQITLTAGTGSCNHVVIRNAANNNILGVVTRADLQLVDVDGDPPALNRIREFIRRYKIANPSATVAQIKTAVEAETF